MQVFEYRNVSIKNVCMLFAGPLLDRSPQPNFSAFCEIFPECNTNTSCNNAFALQMKDIAL